MQIFAVVGIGYTHHPSSASTAIVATSPTSLQSFFSLFGFFVKGTAVWKWFFGSIQPILVESSNDLKIFFMIDNY